MDEIIVVTCSGCDDKYVGGFGGGDDPVEDVTFDPDAQTFVCAACYFAVEGEAPSFIPMKNKRIHKN